MDNVARITPVAAVNEELSTLSGDFDVFRMLGAVEYAKSRVLAQVEPD